MGFCHLRLAPLLLSLNGQSRILRCGTMTSLPVSFWVYWSFKCALGKLLYFVQESFLWHHSWRALCISQPTDLDIIKSEREITAGSNCNLLHICLFMTVCGPQSQTSLYPGTTPLFVLSFEDDVGFQLSSNTVFHWFAYFLRLALPMSSK